MTSTKVARSFVRRTATIQYSKAGNDTAERPRRIGALLNGDPTLSGTGQQLPLAGRISGSAETMATLNTLKQGQAAPRRSCRMCRPAGALGEDR